jgi:retron-type reverse transcriptase
VLEGDITACYDGISHEWLDEHVPMDKGLLRKWLKSGYIECKPFVPRKKVPRKAVSQPGPAGGMPHPRPMRT